MKGWKYESMRHGLAAKGIKSATKKDEMRARIPTSTNIFEKKSKFGYTEEWYNPDAPNDDTVYIAETMQYPGYTAEKDNPKDSNNPIYIDHGNNLDKLGKKMAKEHKHVKYLV